MGGDRQKWQSILLSHFSKAVQKLSSDVMTLRRTWLMRNRKTFAAHLQRHSLVLHRSVKRSWAAINGKQIPNSAFPLWCSAAHKSSSACVCSSAFSNPPLLLKYVFNEWPDSWHEGAEISLSASSLVDTQSNELSIELSMARKRNICHNGKGGNNNFSRINGRFNCTCNTQEQISGMCVPLYDRSKPSMNSWRCWRVKGAEALVHVIEKCIYFIISNTPPIQH